MLRALLLTATLALAACAASPAADSDGPTFALGSDLNCNASEVRLCSTDACDTEPGEVRAHPISLHVPESGGAGRFCQATGCEDAQFSQIITRPTAWIALMRTDGLTEYNAQLEIARDLRTFRLLQPDSVGFIIWTGECSPAGS